MEALGEKLNRVGLRSICFENFKLADLSFRERAFLCLEFLCLEFLCLIFSVGSFAALL